MYFETTSHYPMLLIALEDGETLENEGQIIEAMANSVDITFGELLNEGYPVNLGNMCAQYEFSLFVDGEEYLFGMSNYDFDNLMETGELELFSMGARYSFLRRFETPSFGNCNVLNDNGDLLFVYRNRDNRGDDWLECTEVKILETLSGETQYLISDTCQIEEDYCNSLQWANFETASKIVHMMEKRYSGIMEAANGR